MAGQAPSDEGPAQLSTGGMPVRGWSRGLQLLFIWFPNRKLQVSARTSRPRADSEASSSASLPAYIPSRTLTDTRRPLLGSTRLSDSNSSISSTQSTHSVPRRHYYTSTPRNKPKVNVTLNGMKTSPTDHRTHYISPEPMSRLSTRVSPDNGHHQAATRIKQLEKEVSW